MRLFYLLLITVTFQFSAYSQIKPVEVKNFNFGIRAGLAHSNLYGSKVYNTYPSGSAFALDKAKVLISYTAGLWASCKLSPEFSIVGEVNLTEKGQRNTFGGIMDSRKYEMTISPKLQYLAVPVVVQYNMKNFNRLGLYAGFEMAWLLAAKQEVTGTYDFGTTNIKSDFGNDDLGIVAGVNYVLVKGIMFDARFVNGLKDISLPSENTFVKNKSFQLAFKFYLSK